LKTATTTGTFEGGCYDDKGSLTSSQESGTIKMVFV